MLDTGLSPSQLDTYFEKIGLNEKMITNLNSMGFYRIRDLVGVEKDDLIGRGRIGDGSIRIIREKILAFLKHGPPDTRTGLDEEQEVIKAKVRESWGDPELRKKMGLPARTLREVEGSFGVQKKCPKCGEVKTINSTRRLCKDCVLSHIRKSKSRLPILYGKACIVCGKMAYRASLNRLGQVKYCGKKCRQARNDQRLREHYRRKKKEKADRGETRS